MGMALMGWLWVLCCGSNCASIPGGEVLDCDVEWSFAPSLAEFRAPNSPGERLWRPVLHLARGLQQSAGNVATCPHSWTVSRAAGLQCDSVLKSFSLCSRTLSVELAVRAVTSAPPGEPCFLGLRRQVWVWTVNSTALKTDRAPKSFVSRVGSLESASSPFHPSSWTPWISLKLCIIHLAEESHEKQQSMKTPRRKVSTRGIHLALACSLLILLLWVRIPSLIWGTQAYSFCSCSLLVYS